MSDVIIKSSIDDPETVKVRNRVFVIAAIALSIVPFIVYNAFFNTKTEIVFVEKACTDILMKDINKGR
jgi:hypothetical protein